MLERLTTPAAPPLRLFDTHAGAGAYPMDRGEGRRTGEAEAARALMAADPAALPPALARLRRAVAGFNEPGGLSLYPGSPCLATAALRPQDSYLGCELQPDQAAELQRRLGQPRSAASARAQMRLCDGFQAAAAILAARLPTLVLVDPPYERADDYLRTAELAASRPAPARQPTLIWTPLKDLETLDAFLARLEAARPASLLVVQARLRPLSDPMRLNGCALVLVDGPDIGTQAEEAAGWIVSNLGESGGAARVEQLAGPAT